MVGSKVTIRGVKVGIVKKIEFSTETNKIHVLIRIGPMKNPELLEASLMLANFIGYSSIDLYYVKLGYVLPKIDGHTQIRTAPSLTKKMRDAIEGLVNENGIANVEEVGKNFLTRIAALVTSIEQISQKTNDFLDDCATLSKTAITSFADLKNTNRRLDLVFDNTNQILTGTQLQEFLKTGSAITIACNDASKLARRTNKTMAKFETSPIDFLFSPPRRIELKVRKKSG